MKKLITRVIAIMIILSLSAFALTALSACEKSAKRAILVLPGVMGSIYYTLDGEGNKIAVWSGESPDEFASSFSNMKLLVCDDEGNPVHSNVYVAGWEDKELWKYGANLKMIAGPDQQAGEGDVIRTLTQEIDAEYGDRYEVRAYQYDWRLDLRFLGQQLEEFINSQGYTEVILVTHSMGGMVASNYLARNEANREKVKLFVPIACPLLGSVEIYSYMETGAFPGYDNLPFDISSLTGFGNTIQSAYQLFPSRTLYSSYPEGFSPISINNQPLSYDEATEMLKTRNWAQKKNSAGTRPQLDTMEQAFNGLYDDQGAHVTTKVNTYYIAGNGYLTRYNINYSTSGIYDNLNKADTINRTISGDSIVPLYSAALGMIDENGNPTADNVFVYNTNKYSHMYLASMPEVKAKVIELVATIQP